MKAPERIQRGKAHGRGIKGLLALFLSLCLAASATAAPTGAPGKERLMEAIRNEALKELKNTVSESVELNGVRIVKGEELLDENAAYTVGKATANGYSGRNRITFSIPLTDGKLKEKRLLVEASYDVLAEIFISARPLAAGTALTEEDFYSVRQKASRLPAGAITSRQEIEGKVLKAAVGQGVVIRHELMNAPSGARRGQKVTVIVEGDNVAISTKGMLRNDAFIGGAAKVFCEVSRKEVNGVLVSPTTVKVKI